MHIRLRQDDDDEGDDAAADRNGPDSLGLRKCTYLLLVRVLRVEGRLFFRRRISENKTVFVRSLGGIRGRKVRCKTLSRSSAAHTHVLSENGWAGHDVPTSI